MKIQIICETCNKIAELIPQTNTEEVSIYSINKNFIVGVDWENEIKDNFQEGFIADLSFANSIETTKQVLFQDLTENIYAETSDFDLCFTCKGCGEQIILNDFLQS
ncbi:hypothetical protein [Planococcus shixiaomingii]|uniref:hypothetical protein n=1 Tax=Planococcus shixiaomingii TaxID=3058393 RepID=UPI00262ED78B|nr:hypothetical protein [Planococcus sp. N022]WKA53441.1 hypothetical protein QWY21_12300 [Planococcus sp. N022]